MAASLRGSPVQPWLGVELRGLEGGVRALVFAAGIPEARLRHLLAEALPGARLDPHADEVALRRIGRRVRVRSLRPWCRDHAPLATSYVADPSGLLLRSLGDTLEGEAAAVQLLFTPAPRRARRRLLAEAARLRGGKRRRSRLELAVLGPFVVLGAVARFFAQRPRGSAAYVQPAPVWLDRPRVQALVEKAGEPLFSCSLRLAAAAPSWRLAGVLLADFIPSPRLTRASSLRHLGRGWPALTAIGTVGAVVVALYLGPLRDRRRRPVLDLETGVVQVLNRDTQAPGSAFRGSWWPGTRRWPGQLRRSV